MLNHAYGLNFPQIYPLTQITETLIGIHCMVRNLTNQTQKDKQSNVKIDGGYEQAIHKSKMVYNV